MAVVDMPTPIGLVRISLSPFFAPAFVKICSGWIVPVTDKPNLGSLSSIECPPTRLQSASCTLSLAPLRISVSIDLSRSNIGKATMMAEENEKDTLRGLVQSPASLIDIILGKV